jgi:hypothetical protein
VPENPLETELREALVAQDFERAGRLLAEFRARFDVLWASGVNRAELLQGACELLSWGRRVTLAARAATADRRANLSTAVPRAYVRGSVFA